jgi:hypothetical protein
MNLNTLNVNWIKLAQDMSSCKISGSIKGKGFLNQLNYYHLLKNDSDPCD